MKAILPLLLAVISLAAAPVSFKDSFDNYALASGAPNWVVHSGKWEFKGGAVRHLDQMFNGGLMFLDKKSFRDCRLKVRFNPQGSASLVRAAGLVFRAKDCYNFYWVHYDVLHSQVVLARRSTNTIWIVVARAEGVKIAPGVWHEGEVTAVGKKITVRLDGKVVLEKEDGVLAEGRVGLRSGMGVLAFDDFEVSGTPADDSKFKMTYDTPEDGATRRLEVPRVLASRNCGYFPVLLHLGGQRLGAVIRAGATHVGIGGRLDWIHSEDGGRTWSKPTVVADSKFDDRNPAALVTRDGRIIVLYAENNAYNEKGDYNLKYGHFSLFQTESADGGRTWSPKRPIVFEGYPDSSVYGQGITLANGDLLVPWYWKGGGFLRSTDGGRTWQPPKVIASCSEVAFVETAPGRLLAIARSHEASLLLRSADNGETWSKPEPLMPKGIHPATIVKLADGRLFAAFGHRIRPYGIKVAISHDHGRTWNPRHSAFISWDSGNTDSGYPSAVQLADGSVAVISYAVGSGLLPVVPQSQCAILSPTTLQRLGEATEAAPKTGTFQFGDGRKGYLFLPEGFQIGKPARFLLFLHGRGAAPGTAGNFGSPGFAKFRRLCSERNIVVAVPPLHATWFNAQAEKDIDAMLAHLAAALKMDLGRFPVIGCSMGGMSALLYAGRHPKRVSAVCDIFGPADIRAFCEGEYKKSIKAAYGGYYAERKEFYESRNPMNYLGVLKDIPLLIIHGETDAKVPPEQSRTLAAELKKLGAPKVELVMVPRVGHNNKIVKGFEERILDFLALVR